MPPTGFTAANDTVATTFTPATGSQPAGVGHGAVEILGEAAVLVLLQPVFAVELGAQLADAVLDGELLFCEGEIHFSGPNDSTPATTS
jgi:hypothetical protein